MVAATAIIWAVGLIIATYAGTPPSFIVISIVLWFLWIGWQIRQRNPEFACAIFAATGLVEAMRSQVLVRAACFLDG